MTPVAAPPAAPTIAQTLRRRWPLLVVTPLATALLALAFVLVVTPVFRVATSVRLVEDESGIGGALPAAPVGGAGGLSFLSALTGRGVPLQTEMAVLSSRGRIEELVEELGLRVEVRTPRRVSRASVLAEVAVGLDGPEGTLTLERQADGTFRVTTRLLESRDPFRAVRGERFVKADAGAVRPGEPLPLEGARIVLAAGAAEHGRIVLRLVPRDRTLRQVERALAVTRLQREADVVSVEMEWTDPEVAAQAVNRLVEGYLAYREEVRVDRARRSSDFLRMELDSLHTELADAEEGLRRFREARDVIAPEAQVGAEVERLAELKGRRDLLQAEREALARLMAEVDEEHGAEGSRRRAVFFPSLLQSQATAEILRLLGELETERALLLERRTADARGIELMDVRVRELEVELQAAAHTYLQGLGDQVAALDAALAGFEAVLAQVPAVEMEYLRHRRRVELLTELALFLETSRKEAELTAAREGVGAYVLSLARPPQEPSSPRPALTLALGLLMGLFLGVAGAVALERGAHPASTE